MAPLTQTKPVTLITPEDLRVWMQPHAGPCISIYMPATPMPDQAQANRTRFKSQLQKAERSLAESDLSPAEAEALLAPLKERAADEEFGHRHGRGFVALRSADRFETRRVMRELPELAIVAESFHVKPLIRLVQSSHPFDVLCVSTQAVALWRGNRDALEPVELHGDVPGDMAEAIGPPAHVTKTKRSMQDPADSDDTDSQLRRFFGRLDKALLAHHRSGLPMVLAALPEYQGRYRDVSGHPDLVEQPVARDPFRALEPGDLAKLAWEAVRPAYRAQWHEMRERFGEAAASGLAAKTVEDAARAVALGQLELLMVREDHHEGGRIDPQTGALDRRELTDPRTDDLLDDLAELTLRQSGRVVVLPADEMPGDEPVAAIKRRGAA